MKALTLEQYGAYRTAMGIQPGQEMSIVAPAGSGKTRLAQVIGAELGARIITYTRRAGRDLVRRGCADAGTLYSLAAQHTPWEVMERVVNEDVELEAADIWAQHQGLTFRNKCHAAETMREHGPRLENNGAMLAHLPREDRVWIVDEAQDITPTEAAAIRRCAGSIIWIGDPWQQIYSWRGSEGIPRRTADATLTTNFRSLPAVVEAAAEMSGRPERSHPSNGVNRGRTAYLCRTNWMARAVAVAKNATLVAKPDARRLALLHIQALAELGTAWARVLRPMPSWEAAVRRWGAGMQTASPKTFLVWSATLDMQDFVADEGDVTMTIHAAKGLEFPRVVILDWEPSGNDPDDARLRYVAQTRGINEVDWREPEEVLR